MGMKILKRLCVPPTPLIACAILSLTACAPQTLQERSALQIRRPPVTVGIVDPGLGTRLHAVLTDATRQGFSGAVIVAQGDRVILRAGYGWADRERGRAYRPDTLHEIGSITKVFTALAILQLATEGRLSLTAPVSRYLPQAAEPGASVTIEQLLRHRAGIVEYCGRDDEVGTYQDLLSRCMAAPLVSRPGSETHYSNPGYSILAAVVQEVSGMPFEQYIKQKVTGPLQLRNTHYSLPANRHREVARGYVDGRPTAAHIGRAADGQHWQVFGNGGLVSTAGDMHRLHSALAGRRSMNSRLRGTLVAPPEGAAPGSVEYRGFAYLLNQQGEITSISHAGSDGAFASYFYWKPESDIFFYVTGNNGEDAVLPVVRALRSALNPS